MAGRIDKGITASHGSISWNEISFPAPAVIETKRLLIRPLHIFDAPIMAELCNDDNIASRLTNRFPYPYSLANAEYFINKFGIPPADGRPWNQFAITLKDDPAKLVGCIGIHPGADVFCRSAELGYWIGSQYHGKGYATEVAGAVVSYSFSLEDGLWGTKGESVTHVALHTYGNNAASRRVAEKLGFRYEGTSKGAIYKRGVVLDLIMFGKSREDWEGEKN